VAKESFTMAGPGGASGLKLYTKLKMKMETVEDLRLRIAKEYCGLEQSQRTLYQTEVVRNINLYRVSGRKYKDKESGTSDELLTSSPLLRGILDQQHGTLKQLKWDDSLAEFAFEQSLQMVNKHKLRFDTFKRFAQFQEWGSSETTVINKYKKLPFESKPNINKSVEYQYIGDHNGFKERDRGEESIFDKIKSRTARYRNLIKEPQAETSENIFRDVSMSETISDKEIEASARAVVAGWSFSESGHASSMMDSQFTAVGVGVAMDKVTRHVFVTAIFAARHNIDSLGDLPRSSTSAVSPHTKSKGSGFGFFKQKASDLMKWGFGTLAPPVAAKPKGPPPNINPKEHTFFWGTPAPRPPVAAKPKGPPVKRKLTKRSLTKKIIEDKINARKRLVVREIRPNPKL
jgi:uncharacterized protein YkwD